MSKRGEAAVGLAIVACAIAVLGFDVRTTHEHFAAIAAADRTAAKVATVALAPSVAIASPRLVTAPIASHNAPGSIDSIVPQAVGRYRLTGWVVMPDLSHPAHVLAIVDGTTRIDVTGGYGQPREDVARALNSVASSHAGLDVLAKLPKLRPGQHRITLAVAGPAGGSLATLPVESVFTVK